MTTRDGLKWGEGGIKERPRKDGTIAYQAKWITADGLHTVEHARTFNTREDAEDHLRTIHRKKLSGRYQPPSKRTVNELVDDYIERAASRVSERTVLTYRLRAERMIAPTIGKRTVDAVTPLDVQRWIDDLGKRFKPSTVHAAVAVIMGAFREAAVLGITESHLGQGIRRPTIGKSEATVWTEDEARRVLQSIKDDETYGALYCLELYAGLRPGELRALKWADVDLVKGELTVRRTISRTVEGEEVIVDRTKTNQVRVIPLDAALVARLKWHKARQNERYLRSEAWRQQGVVFDGGDGHFLYQGPWQRWHQRMCARLGVPAIRAHDLRHTAITLMVEAGIHPKVIADIAGHASIDITMDRYSHPSQEHQRRAMQSMSGLFGLSEPVSESSVGHQGDDGDDEGTRAQHGGAS